MILSYPSLCGNSHIAMLNNVKINSSVHWLTDILSCKFVSFLFARRSRLLIHFSGFTAVRTYCYNICFRWKSCCFVCCCGSKRMQIDYLCWTQSTTNSAKINDVLFICIQWVSLYINLMAKVKNKKTQKCKYHLPISQKHVK